MNEPNRPHWQIILAAAVIFGFFVLLTVIRTSKTDTTPEPTPTTAESPIAEESAHTPAPTPTESTAETTAPEEPAETTAPEENGELFSKDYIGSGYKTIYNTYLKATSNTLEYGLTAKGDGYYIVNDTEDAVEILQYDRESANGSCGLYVYERCEKDAYGGWSRQEAQILNIYAYRYWEDIAVASGKTGWGDAPSREYSELTGE